MDIVYADPNICTILDTGYWFLLYQPPRSSQLLTQVLEHGLPWRSPDCLLMGSEDWKGRCFHSSQVLGSSGDTLITLLDPYYRDWKIIPKRREEGNVFVCVGAEVRKCRCYLGTLYLNICNSNKSGVGTESVWGTPVDLLSNKQLLFKGYSWYDKYHLQCFILFTLFSTCIKCLF